MVSLFGNPHGRPRLVDLLDGDVMLYQQWRQTVVVVLGTRSCAWAEDSAAVARSTAAADHAGRRIELPKGAFSGRVIETGGTTIAGLSALSSGN